jgi:hypothetical protein
MLYAVTKLQDVLSMYRFTTHWSYFFDKKTIALCSNKGTFLKTNTLRFIQVNFREKKQHLTLIEVTFWKNERFTQYLFYFS